MYRTLCLLMGFILCYTINGSKDPPVTWEVHAAKIANNLYEVDLHAFIEQPWFIFPTKLDKNSVYIPTAISFDPNAYLKAVDTIEEKGSLVNNHYENEVVFSQYFSFRHNVKRATLNGTIQWEQFTPSNTFNVRSKHFSIIITRE